MNKVILLMLLIGVLALTACSSAPAFPDYSSPEAAISSLKFAASQEDVVMIYDVFSDAFKEETGVTYNLFEQSLIANPAEFERMANIEIQQVFDDGSVVVVLLTDGDRMFFVAEQGLWKIRMIAPAAQPTI